MTSTPAPSAPAPSNILVLVGSAKRGFNDALARAATAFLEERGHTVTRYNDLAQLPHYDETLDGPGVHQKVDEFRAAVEASDALLLVTPEYNGGPSTLIKNAIDVASRPRGDASISGKPVAAIGATPSPGGTAHARAALQLGARIAGAAPLELTYGVASAHTRLGDAGYDAEVLAEVHGVLEELVRLAQPTDD